MASTIGNLLIKLFMDDNQFVRGVERSRKHLGRLDRNVSQAGSGINKLIASYVGFRAVVTATNKVMEGAALEREEHRMRGFAGSTSNATMMLEAFNRGANNTVDRLTAMQQASRILGMGLAETPAQMQKIVEAATRLGKQTDTAEQRLEAFTALLANQSKLRLDNFSLSSAKVTERMDELEKAFPGMTKEARFMQATFEQIDQTLGRLGPRQDDALSRFEKIKTSMRDASLEITKTLAPAIADLIADMGSLTAMMTGEDTAGSGIGKVASGVTAFFSAVVRGLERIALAIKIVVGAVQATFSGIIGIMLSMSKKMFEAVDSLVGGLIPGMDEITSQLDIMSQAFIDTGNEIAAKAFEDIERLLGKKAKNVEFGAGRPGDATLPAGAPAAVALNRFSTAIVGAQAAISDFTSPTNLARGIWSGMGQRRVLEDSMFMLAKRLEHMEKNPPVQAPTMSTAFVAGSAEFANAVSGIKAQEVRDKQKQFDLMEKHNELLESIREALKNADAGETTLLIAGG